MIGRFALVLPFSLTIPEGENFKVKGYTDKGYMVEVFPPKRRRQRVTPEFLDGITIDGVEAFQADALQIDFHKESFDRGEDSPIDPPEDVIQRAVESFLLRLRHATRASQVHRFSFSASSRWRIEYLNDDGTELQMQTGLARKREGWHGQVQWIALNAKIWDSMHTVAPAYVPPPWEEFLLDAQEELPRVGPAVVLAATSLEVFVARALDQLAKVRPVDPEIWKWVNNRGFWLQNPSVEEQYDTLLKLLAGHSLKEDQALWTAFQHLRKARNSFVHDGLASIGKTAVDASTAAKLIADAWAVISKVREWMPQESRWYEFKRENLKIESLWKVPTPSAPTPAEGAAKTSEGSAVEMPPSASDQKIERASQPGVENADLVKRVKRVIKKQNRRASKNPARAKRHRKKYVQNVVEKLKKP